MRASGKLRKTPPKKRNFDWKDTGTFKTTKSVFKIQIQMKKNICKKFYTKMLNAGLINIALLLLQTILKIICELFTATNCG